MFIVRDTSCIFYRYGDHRKLHVLTHSFPTQRSTDLYHLGVGGSSDSSAQILRDDGNRRRRDRRRGPRAAPAFGGQRGGGDRRVDRPFLLSAPCPLCARDRVVSGDRLAREIGRAHV